MILNHQIKKKLAKKSFLLNWLKSPSFLETCPNGAKDEDENETFPNKDDTVNDK